MNYLCKNCQCQGIKYVSINEAAIFLCVNRQSIYAAIKRNVLPNETISGKIYISLEELKKYASTKYDRRKSHHNGELKFSKDEYSPKEIVDAYGIDKNRIYYLLKVGTLKSIRKGGSYIIHKNDIENFLKSDQL